jgi:hypothetical protein
MEPQKRKLALSLVIVLHSKIKIVVLDFDTGKVAKKRHPQ